LVHPLGRGGSGRDRGGGEQERGKRYSQELHVG